MRKVASRGIRVLAGGMLAAVLAVVPASCTGRDAGEPRPEPAINEQAIPVDGAGVAFPIEAFAFTEDQLRAVNRARDLLMQECMRQFGIDVAVGEPAGRLKPNLDQRFGLISLEQAEQFGYQPDPAQLARQAAPFQHRVPGEHKWLLTGQGETTFAGKPVPVEGCQGEAGRRLRTSEDHKGQIVEDIRREALTRSNEDSRVTKKVAEWSACMKEAGLRYTVVTGPERHWNTMHAQSGLKVTEREIDEAKIDVRCKRETGLIRTWMAVVIAYEERLIEEKTQALTEAQKVSEEVLKNAARVFAGDE